MVEREGLLAATPLVLRFAPDRRSCAATSKIAFGDFVEPSMEFCPPGWLLEISNLLIHNKLRSPAFPSLPDSGSRAGNRGALGMRALTTLEFQ
jgi:hypothetical protein